MAVRIVDTKKAADLFGAWPEAVLWSCLDNTMGAVYADSRENPGSAMAVLGDFCFLAGRPDKEIVTFKPGWCTQGFIIMIPQNEGWVDIIRKCYGGKAKPVTRYAFKKEWDAFDRNRLKDTASSLPPGYVMKMMDKENFESCRANAWSRDLVSQFTAVNFAEAAFESDYNMYRKLGIGTVILKDGELVSGASSYARYRGGIEIEIDTKEEYRRKGLAYACGARLILECLEQGLYPSWDAQNKGSAALAGKLGYHLDHEYTAYEIWGY